MTRLASIAMVLAAGMGALLGSVPEAAAQPFDLPDFRVELEPAQYKMVSVPVPLQDRSFEAVLGDDYGRYAPGLWRLFRYNSVERTYDEFPDLGVDFSPGIAVWLIHRFGQGFDIDEDIFVDPNTLQPVRLTVFNGWNQVGTPFPFTISDCAGLLRAAARELPTIRRIETPMRYDGRNLVPTNTCEPWQGYFIFVESDGRAEVVIDRDLLGRVAARPAPDDPARELEAAGGYLVQLSATMPEAGLEDSYNFAGLLPPGGTPQQDALDFREPPMIGPHIRLAFVEGGQRFGGRFRAAAEGGAVWNIEVGATRADHPIDVRIDARGTLPDGFQRYLLDRDERVAVALDSPSFRVRLRDTDDVRRFTLILGTPAFAALHAAGIDLVPTSHTLLSAYPNPFNPETTLRYRLGQTGPAMLAVYDMLGRRVRVLVDEVQPPGIHEVRWDGRDDTGQPVASGLYFYRLEADAFRQTRAMTLIR